LTLLALGVYTAKYGTGVTARSGLHRCFLFSLRKACLVWLAVGCNYSEKLFEELVRFVGFPNTEMIGKSKPPLTFLILRLDVIIALRKNINCLNIKF